MIDEAAAVASVQPWEEHFRTALQLAGVIAGVATIATALFLQWFLVRSKRPRLSLSLSANLDDEDWVCLDFADRIELYLRLRVNSQAKKVTAHNVEVLLLKVHRPLQGKAAPVVPSRELAWADTPNERIAIPSGTWRRVDVLKLSANPNSGSAGTLIPALRTYEPRTEPSQRSVEPLRQYATERDLLREDGSYLFELAITADEIEASRWRLSFDYLGAPAVEARDLLPQISQVVLEQVK